MKEDAENGSKVSDCAEEKHAASVRSGLCCESNSRKWVLKSCNTAKRHVVPALPDHWSEATCACRGFIASKVPAMRCVSRLGGCRTMLPWRKPFLRRM